MKTMRPTTGFGETFQYSNLLVSVGGYAAGRCYQPGLSLAAGYLAAMHDLIFKPLSMTETFLTKSEAFRHNAAAPHALNFDGSFASIDPTFELSVESVAPAGGAWSTAEDMAKYVSLELRGGKTPDGVTLLSEEAVQSRWRGGIKIDDQTSYGLGLIHGYKQGVEVTSHVENTFGFTSDMFFLPKHDRRRVTCDMRTTPAMGSRLIAIDIGCPFCQIQRRPEVSERSTKVSGFERGS